MAKFRLFIIVLIAFLVIPSGIVSAQIQDGNFSGNNPDSYSCYTRQGDRIEATPTQDPVTGSFYCDVNNQRGFQPCLGGVYDEGASCDPQAVLNPPTLQQLEIWFVRIVYAIWAISATFSFLGIVAIGYQYMISRGAPEATAKVKDRIAKFIIGFCLVFLAVPILNTIFRLLAVNDSVQCYSGLTSNVGIGFQFVFPELCTAPNIENAVSGSEICNEILRLGRTQELSIGRSTGLACAQLGDQSPICGFNIVNVTVGINFRCESGNTWVPRAAIGSN